MRKDWEYKKLGEVCDILDSQRKPVTKKDRKKGIYPYYGATGIQDFVDNYIFDGRYVLVGEDGAKWSANEKCAYIIEGKTWINNHAHVLSTKNMVIDSFLTYYLNFSDLDSYISGAIIRKLTQSSLKSIPIPLPPKPTQLAIVAELDKINELIQLKKQQLKDYDQLAQSIFYEMFGDPVENEKGWEVKKLGEVCETSSGGTPSKTHTEYYENGTIPWLRSGEVSQGYIYDAEIYISELGLNKSSAKIFPKDTVLIAMYGATVGEVGILCNPMCTNQAICGILPNDLYNSEFLRYVLLSHKDKYLSLASGGAQPNISQQIIKSTLIPFIDKPLQQQFAARIEAIERQKQQVSETIKDLETLLASRMQYWFD